MIKRCLSFTLCLTSGLFLTACEIAGPVIQNKDIAPAFRDIPKQKFVAGGFNRDDQQDKIPVDKFTNEEFKHSLAELDANRCKPNMSLTACLNSVRRGADSNEKFNNLSGITARAFLQTAQSQGKFGGGRDVIVKGQISETCLHSKRNLPGYEYRHGKLRICVVMVTLNPHPGKNPVTGKLDPKILYQYFHVEADAHVEKRTDYSLGSQNVFPTAAAATGLTIDYDTALNKDGKDFNYKLYAAGGPKGSGIRVIRYWEATKLDIDGDPAWKKYTKNTPGMPARIANFFKPSRESCVDMMFLEPVKATMPPSQIGGIHYCLGRCDNPPIVNTR